MKTKLNFNLLKLLFFMMLLLTTLQMWGQTPFTATYTFGNNGNVPSFTYNGTSIPGVTMGAMVKEGITSTSNSGNFRGSNWPTANALNTSRFIGFTMTAVSGYEFTVTSITFGIGRSGTGTTQSQWRGSHNSYGSAINNYTSLHSGLTNSNGVLTNPNSNSSWTGNVLNVASNYTDVTSAGFRLFMYNADAGGGTAGLQGAITISGTYKPVVTSYTVTFNRNGAGLGAMANQTESSTTALIPNAFINPGFVFTGWNTATNGLGVSYSDGANYLFTSSTTLYAQWTNVITNNPIPYDLSLGNYTLNSWEESSSAGTYPPNMIFWINNAGNDVDPTLATPFIQDWVCHYNLGNRSRFLGEGNSGIGFLNTGNMTYQDECMNTSVTNVTDRLSGKPGAIVLALNTIGRRDIQVEWTGRTTALPDNNRVYALRIQYRIGDGGGNANTDWIDFVENSEYVSQVTAGFSQNFTTNLPVIAENQPLVQVRWVYYQVSGTSGSRPRLALDDINVSSCAPAIALVSPSSGAPVGTGIMITLNGNNFTEGNDYLIDFGSDIIIGTAISSTQIKVTIPEGATGGFILETNLNCDTVSDYTIITENNSGCE